MLICPLCQLELVRSTTTYGYDCPKCTKKCRYNFVSDAWRDKTKWEDEWEYKEHFIRRTFSSNHAPSNWVHVYGDIIEVMWGFEPDLSFPGLKTPAEIHTIVDHYFLLK